MALTTDLLNEALDAYHRLQVGRAVRVFVDQNGERVEYSAANSVKLLQYIADLRAQIAAEAGDLAAPRGPMGVRFL